MFRLMLLALSLMLTSAPSAFAQAPAPPSVIKIEMTQQQIEANINALDAMVRAVGLSNPQQVQNALGLMALFQFAVKADVDAKAKAATVPAPAFEPHKE